MRRAIIAVAAVLCSIAAARSLPAQAWAYPSFQPPRTTVREFNFGVADAGNAGTTLLFQWREEMAPMTQLSLDLGIADPDFGADLLFLIGGQYAHQLGRESAEMPLDFLLTFGVYGAFGDGMLFRFPFGVSIGHRFPLEGQLAMTPYVHPRLSIDVCSDCSGDNTDLNVSFDLGLNFELSSTIALRLVILFSGSDRFDDTGLGMSLAWTPKALARLRRR